jgi:pimeloyl-ACP methyl ester carboxylesterase
VVQGADHVQVHPPHDYGVAVVLLTLAGELVPPEQVGPLSAGIEGFLLASSLDMVDKPRALAEFARMRDYADTLAEPAATLMRYVNDRNVRDLGARLLPIVDRLADHPAMPALSPERAPRTPAAPVYLLHGTDDNVIPSVETVLLGEYLQGKSPVRGLLSGLITHAEVNRAPTATEAWRLASFWRQVFAK